MQSVGWSRADASGDVRWMPVPLVTAAARAAGHAGGEGAQWPQALAISPDASVALLGTDVGGVYRSTDLGRTWTPSNRGLLGRGVSDFAFDPKMPARVLLVAGNSLERDFHGIFLSEDAGLTWRPVLPYGNRGYRDAREQVAYDPTSAGPEGFCRVAYWAAATTEGRRGAIFKSEDGGVTWRELPGTGRFADYWLQVSPADGALLVGGGAGVWRSGNGGADFEQVMREPVAGLGVSAAAPERVYAVRGPALWRSDDAGRVFRKVEGRNLPPQRPGRGGTQRVYVSPADADRVLVDNDEGDWKRTRYVSLDGGRSFERTRFDPAGMAPTFLPVNNRDTVAAWHPSDPAAALSFGGDMVTRTADGGRSWSYSNDGYNGIMVGSGFQFNLRDPDLVHLPSQDYDGAVTADGGRTWSYVNTSGWGWGGYTYGSYAFTPTVIAVGAAPGPHEPRELAVTTDGGRTRRQKVARIGGADFGYGDPRDALVGFVSNLRTADGGRTWSAMPGVRAVYTHDPASGTLYAAGKGGRVLASADRGKSWREISGGYAGEIRDLAFAPGRLFVADGESRLWRLDLAEGSPVELTERLAGTWQGERGAWSVAVDPQAPEVVYVARPGNTYLSDAAAQRSVDGGDSWMSLNAPPSGPDGGREAQWVRVHPRTREAWFGTNCFGLWRLAPPEAP